MVKTSSDDASSSSRKRSKTFDNGGVAPWSGLNHDVLFLIMMKLGFVDFFAFSRVCKSWRSLAVSNKNTFMASQPPMEISIYMEANENDYIYCCCLQDFEGRKFKTIIPHYVGRTCVGLTCGYLILFGWETRDFWLVNPITRHELHFPDCPIYVSVDEVSIGGILVFSPSISGWVFVVLHRKISPYGTNFGKILFYISGKQGWNHVSSTLPVIDLHVFKGKIYTLHSDYSLGELRPNVKQKHKSMLLETKNFPKIDLLEPKLVSSGEKLYVIDRYTELEKILELDFGEMKWVLPEKTIIREYAFFISWYSYSFAIKPESWVGPQTRCKSYVYFLASGKIPHYRFNHRWMWYFFPHDCLNVILLDDQ